jgi:hypothetical protein
MPDFSDLMRQEREWTHRAQSAQATAAQAFARLLAIAERSDTGQAARVARFIAATFDGPAFALDLFSLRAVDVTISDDMLACIDALRWGKADLHKLVPDGEQRVRALLATWGLV